MNNIKKLTTILMMLFTISSISQKQINFAGMTFGSDKLFHAGVGTGIGIGTIYLDMHTERELNPFAGTLISLVAATGKEMFDSFNGGRFNGQDIIWTIVPTFTIDLGKIIFKKRKRPNVGEYMKKIKKSKT